MKPTNELRFVIRKLHPEEPTDATTVRILQQKWIGEDHENQAAQEYLSKWRDVPIEKETKQ